MAHAENRDFTFLFPLINWVIIKLKEVLQGSSREKYSLPLGEVGGRGSWRATALPVHHPPSLCGDCQQEPRLLSSGLSRVAVAMRDTYVPHGSSWFKSQLISTSNLLLTRAVGAAGYGSGFWIPATHLETGWSSGFLALAWPSTG